MPMKVGDVVESKAGGPKMVISEERGNGLWRCVWWHRGEGVFKFYDFSAEALAPYNGSTPD